jgi:hypothetical protein
MTMKTLALTAARVAVIAAPAEARKAKAPAFVGEWCLTQSVQNGHDALTGEYIPHTNSYEWATAECPAEKRETIGPRSLRGLDFSISDDGNSLVVEGWPKKGKR